jgi:hypothetical protein
MKKLLAVLAVVMLCAGWSSARITESIDAGLWSFGPNVPELGNGARGDASSGAYHHLLVGTSSYYCLVANAGQGSVEVWIYDPAKCLQNPDPGYGLHGFGWGLQNPALQAITVGMHRASYCGGCIGYNPWSTIAPTSPWWFKDGIRGSNNVPFTAGWYKWTINGTWNDITFTMYNVTYYEIDGPGNGGLPPVTGNCAQTYSATWADGGWANVFGTGWQAIWLNGDVPGTGIEDISADVVGGDGVFAEYGAVGVSQPYHQTTWGSIKALYQK